MEQAKNVDYLTNKASAVLNFKRNFQSAPLTLGEALRLTNIRTILEYARPTLDTRSLINKLEHIQNHAARFIIKQPRFQHNKH